jgi:hypothetical protein
MKIRSIEPTPSPNSMKLNLDETLPQGQNYRFTITEKEQAPDYLRRLLSINGVTSVFQVLDFIALDRHPKADWEKVLSAARAVLGEATGAAQLPTAAAEMENQAAVPADQDFVQVAVFIQQLRGIPMQIKLVKGDVEQRVGLPPRFKEAVMQAQQAVSNLILERKWVEQPPRYGELEAVGEAVAKELASAYDETRLAKLVARALDAEANPIAPGLSAAELVEALQSPDWEKRYQALDQVEATVEIIPLLERALDDVKMAVRRLAVVTLGFIEDPRVLPGLMKALSDRNAIVRRTAGDTLSDLGFPEAIPAMCQALADKNKLVRWRAARFLYEVGDETAVDALRQAVDDPEYEVRMQAQIALERIERGEAASGTVWQQMTRRMQED